MLELQRMEACEDLKAFERRLMDVVAHMHPESMKWRVVLSLVIFCLLVSAYQWLIDPLTADGQLLLSLWNNKVFMCSLLATIFLLFCGVHKRIVAPNIIISRCRNVLSEFSMSCDENGRLKLQPRAVPNY